MKLNLKRHAVLLVECAAVVCLGSCRATDGVQRDDSPGRPQTTMNQTIDMRSQAVRIEAVSLLGSPLIAPDLDRATRARLESNLEEARLAHERDPADEMNIIWLGRRLAYLSRYNDAVNVFTAGIHRHPESYRLRRHRGHRLITLRRFDDAAADLRRASELIEHLPDEFEPDGAPNPANVPRSTTHTNIWYHLALAHYLNGEFDEAARAWNECLTISPNDDMIVASSYWLCLALHRAGRGDEAARVIATIREEMDVIENHAYHALLLAFGGSRDPEALLSAARGRDLDFATIGYGVGAWLLINGRADRAAAVFREVIDTTGWAAFGHIASEVELARAQEQEEE